MEKKMFLLSVLGYSRYITMTMDNTNLFGLNSALLIIFICLPNVFPCDMSLEETFTIALVINVARISDLIYVGGDVSDCFLYKVKDSKNDVRLTLPYNFSLSNDRDVMIGLGDFYAATEDNSFTTGTYFLPADSVEAAKLKLNSRLFFYKAVNGSVEVVEKYMVKGKPFNIT